MYLLILLLGFFLAIYCFYEGYSVQHKKGVVQESNLGFMILAIVSSIQLIPMFEMFGLSKWYIVVIYVVLIIVFFYIKFYFIGKKVTIYSTTIESVIDTLKQTINELHIPFENNNGLFAEDVFLKLSDHEAEIKISKSGDKEITTVNVSFRKMWRLPEGDEIRFRLIEVFQQKREQKVYWGPLLTNSFFAVLILGFTIFISIQFY